MDLIEGSETSAIINQTPGNYPKENLLYSIHGESLKSSLQYFFYFHGATGPTGPGFVIIEASLTHATLGRINLDE